MGDLKGINVLVDGYNLELPDGTGLKTYGITLILALNLLGAHVDVLTSRDAYNKLNLLKGLIKTVSTAFYKAKKTTTKNPIIKSEVADNFLDFINDSIGLFNLPSCYKIANFLYRSFGVSTMITLPQKIEVWHTTYPLPIKIRSTKKITTIADLIPLKLPHTTLDNKKAYYKNIKESIKASAIIITISEHSKKDICDMFDVMPDKIFVTYPPLMLKPFSSGEKNISLFLKKYNLKLKNYILFVGAIEPRKNVGRLIDAYSMIDTPMPLVIAGKKAWLYEKELARNLKNVRLLGHVPVDDLRYLYGGAYCFVFPSLYEGFGLPPLEAMSSGCPVITSKVASLPEVCGDAALYVDPYNTKNITETIETLLNNQKLRNELAVAGKERARIFSMQNYIQRLYKAYKKIV